MYGAFVPSGLLEQRYDNIIRGLTSPAISSSPFGTMEQNYDQIRGLTCSAISLCLFGTGEQNYDTNPEDLRPRLFPYVPSGRGTKLRPNPGLTCPAISLCLFGTGEQITTKSGDLRPRLFPYVPSGRFLTPHASLKRIPSLHRLRSGSLRCGSRGLRSLLRDRARQYHASSGLRRSGSILRCSHAGLSRPE